MRLWRSRAKAYSIQVTKRVHVVERVAELEQRQQPGEAFVRSVEQVLEFIEVLVRLEVHDEAADC
jgi:hypothetical protein